MHTITDDVRAFLAAGLNWLYNIEQPEHAALHHLGITGVRVGNRSYSFMPAGYNELPVVVVNLVDPQYDKSHIDWPLTNPLGGDAEMTAYRDVLRDLGHEVAEWWNGAHESGSLGLRNPAHPTLVAAVNRYQGGCPDHPKAGVFCKCPWYRTGRALLIEPTWPTVVQQAGEYQTAAGPTA